MRISYLQTAAAVAISLLAGVSGASAASADFDFRGDGGPAASYEFVAGGLGLTVTAHSYTDSYASAGNGLVGQWSDGLGAQGAWDLDHRVDGWGWANDLLVFEFDRPISAMRSVTFHYVDWNDEFEFFTHDGDWHRVGEADLPWSWGSRSATYTFADTYGGSLFGIGARDGNDAFKVSGMSVDYDVSAVPLPAGILLLGGGLAGLGALRRHNRR